MRISVNRDLCIGSGNCARMAPEIFDQDDNGLVTLLVTDPGAAYARVRQASTICPVGAVNLSQRESV
ncbi:ferredoxin [Streptomyces griseus]